MPNYYKGSKNIQFNLSDLEVNEEFSIWKAWDKRNDDIKDPSGNVMTFPIKDGQLTTKAGKVMEVQDLKMMKRKDFVEAFPDLNKQSRYFRNVLIGGGQYLYGFSFSSNRNLNGLIETCKTMGQDPLKVTFEQTFDQSAAPAQMYGMKIIKSANEPTTGQPVVGIPELKPSNNPNARETEIMDAIKSVHGTGASEPAFVQIVVSNGIEESRAKVLYTNHYKG